MRILSADSLCDMLRRCINEPNLLCNIVLSSEERRRNIYRELDSIIFTPVEYRPVRHGCVFSFPNYSMIHISIVTDRLIRVYDDILVDESIDDIELLEKLEETEFSIEPVDLGDFESSTEILEYIGGNYGEADGANVKTSD